MARPTSATSPQYQRAGQHRHQHPGQFRDDVRPEPQGQVPAAILITHRAARIHFPGPAAGGDPGERLENLAELVQSPPERGRIPGRGRDRGTGRLEAVKRPQAASLHRWVADPFQLGPQLPLRMRPQRHPKRPHHQAPAGQLCH
jgi:hypothetical protein